jgi:triacylglycerol lipase
VHGAGFRDKPFGINYWGRIPKYLSRQGITVYYGGTDAWGSVEENGKKVRDTILRLRET